MGTAVMGGLRASRVYEPKKKGKKKRALLVGPRRSEWGRRNIWAVSDRQRRIIAHYHQRYAAAAGSCIRKSKRYRLRMTEGRCGYIDLQFSSNRLMYRNSNRRRSPAQQRSQ